MPQVFLGSLLGTCRSAIDRFFFVALALVTVPEVFAKVNSAQFSSFINGQLLDRDHSRVRQILQFQASSNKEVTHPWHG